MKKIMILVTLSTLFTGCNIQQAQETTKQNENRNETKQDVPVFYKESLVENVKWEESPSFMYDGIQLRGVKDKIGILDVPWKENSANKYMWHFFGEKIPSGEFTVIAIKKDTKEMCKALLSNDIQVWSVEGPSTTETYTHIPAGMKLPSKGLWALNAYINNELFGQIVVNVE